MALTASKHVHEASSISIWNIRHQGWVVTVVDDLKTSAMEDGIVHRPNNIRHHTNFQCWIREEVRRTISVTELKCILSFPHTTTSVMCTKKMQLNIVFSQYSFPEWFCSKQLRKAVHFENQVFYSDSSNTLSLAHQSLLNYPTSSFSRSVTEKKACRTPNCETVVALNC